MYTDERVREIAGAKSIGIITSGKKKAKLFQAVCLTHGLHMSHVFDYFVINIIIVRGDI